MNYVLGVDGGGTKTVARVVALGPNGMLCVLGSGSGPGSNPLSVGWESAQAAITCAAKAAAERAGVELDAAVLAIAGCASPAAKDRLEGWAVRQGWSHATRVVPDTAPLLATVPRGSAAIGLVAGTGSVAVVRRPDGTTETVGGWGYLIDDAGSGYAIGRDALRRVARRADRGEAQDALSSRILDVAGVASAAGIKAFLYGAPDPRRAAAGLAPAVLGLAESGVAEAHSLAGEHAAAMAELAALAASRLGPAERPLVLLSGGLLNGSVWFRSEVTRNLLARGWRRHAVVLGPDAASACALLALDHGA